MHIILCWNFYLLGALTNLCKNMLLIVFITTPQIKMICANDLINVMCINISVVYIGYRCYMKKKT